MDRSLTFSLFGKDVSASRTLDAFGRNIGSTQNNLRDFGRATTVVAGTVAAFAAKSAGEFKKVGGEVRTLSRLTGLAVQDASKLRFAAQQTGVEIEGLAAGIRTLSKHLVANDDAAKQLGFTYRDTAGQILPLDKILAMLADRFASMPDGPEKTALALALFGKQGAALIPLLNKGSEGLAAFNAQAQKLGLVLDKSAIDKLSKASKATRDFDAAMQGLNVQIGQKVLPFQTKLKTELAELATVLASKPFVGEALGTIGVAAQGLTLAVGPITAINEAWQLTSQILDALRKKKKAEVVVNGALAASELAVASARQKSAAAGALEAVSGRGGGFLPNGAGGLLGGPAGGGLLGVLGKLGAAGAIGTALGLTAREGIQGGFFSGKGIKGNLGFALGGPVFSAWANATGGGAMGDAEIAKLDAGGDASMRLANLQKQLNATKEGREALKGMRSEIVGARGDTDKLNSVSDKLTGVLHSVGQNAHDAATGLRVYTLEQRKAIQNNISSDWSKVNVFGELPKDDPLSPGELAKRSKAAADYQANLSDAMQDVQRMLDVMNVPANERAEVLTALYGTEQEHKGTIDRLVKSGSPSQIAAIVENYQKAQRDAGVTSTVRTFGEALGSVEGSAAGQAAYQAMAAAFIARGPIPVNFQLVPSGARPYTTIVKPNGGTISGHAGERIYRRPGGGGIAEGTHAGGRRRAGQMLWVGEAGPELVEMGGHGYVYPGDKSKRIAADAGGGSGQVAVTEVHFHIGTMIGSDASAQREIMELIRRAQRNGQ